jgi:hypothetical protein
VLRPPHHNYIVAGEHSDRSSYSGYSTTAGNAIARHRPPPRLMANLSGQKMSTSPCLAT